MMWQLAMSSDSVDPIRLASCVPDSPRTRQLCPSRLHQAQLRRRSRAAGGLRTARKTECSGRTTKQVYLFRFRIRCAICSRKMEASPWAHGMYYRCPARTLAPGSPALALHPPAVYLHEDPIRDAVNSWISGLFVPESVDRTVEALVASQHGPTTGQTPIKPRRSD
jgi:hypothetical protein